MDKQKERNNQKVEEACHHLACEIQNCLQKQNYDQKRCQIEIQRYKKCIENKGTMGNLLKGESKMK